MDMSAPGDKARWAWATAGAFTLVAIVAALFRTPATPAGRGPAPKVAVKLDASAVLRDEAALFDPTPLFLPTRFNAAPKPVELPEFGAAFPNYPPKLGFEAAGLKLDALALPKPIADPPNPAIAPGAVLAMPAPGPLAAGLGRTDAPVPSLAGRGAYVEIVSADSGRRWHAEALPESARPPGDRPWTPLEFMAAIDPAGLVGPLVLTARSGVEDVDAFFQDYLARTLRVGERLAPGFYRISVGP